ncbi:fungal specific transcription factor domain-containing protein [Colletotrichum orchidophilum]|uniref:Fungal specific transcription factor domain-containing protein n=1 Tax=Colletotrichum orchidophilum TaxID=1209926 RepID=A0A1G4AVC4_9PEZI|nr:fungal specific transcription factor domain-containing protein [Colletotrichum orchidophilum]OHE93129.1 fungal specific transcription factor domain-containing protein [Colletotrichum orchidophilum]
MIRDRHASRASFACVRCKKDKRRCDISQILSSGDRLDRSCTSCRNKNEKCEVRYGEDKRSQRQPNETKALQRRMQALEELVKNVSRSEVASKNSEPPTRHKTDDDSDCLMEQTRRTAKDYQDETTRAFPSPANSSSPGNRLTTISISPPEGGESNWAGILQQEPLPTSQSHRSVSFSGQNRPKTDDITHNALRSISFSGPSRPELDCVNEGFPPVMEEVGTPDSMHDFDQFLGSSTLFPYSENQTRSRSPRSEGPSFEDDSSRRARGALECFPEPEPIVSHLLDLFWKWQSSHLLVVDRALFLRHREIWDESEGDKGDRNYYTPCLLYAIMAVASMISLDKGVVRYSTFAGGVAGETFAKRARTMFDLEMDHPTIATVQAALILGSRYGAMEDNSLGWMYSGIAFRMATKLGLHLDCSKAVASGQMSSEMAELRRRVFWGCHIEDNLFSAYCGRPNSFMEWDVTVSMPERQIEGIDKQDSDPTSSLLHHTSTLSVLCSKILISIHRQKRHLTTSELRLKASQIHRALWQWHHDLPKTLIWSSDSNILAQPHVFILQMNFYFALILLHRPFLRFSSTSLDIDSMSPSTPNSAHACATAAANITKLATTYRRSFNMRQLPPSVVHFIFIAGSIHLLNLRAGQSGNHDVLLQSSTEALSELGKSYPVAQKAGFELDGLIEKWRLAKEAEKRAAETSRAAQEVENHIGPGCAVPPGVSGFMDIDFSPLEEIGEFMDMKKGQQPVTKSVFDMPADIGFNEQLSLDQNGNDCIFLGPEWLHNGAEFENMDGNGCPWLYN